MDIILGSGYVITLLLKSESPVNYLDLKIYSLITITAAVCGIFSGLIWGA